MAEAKTGPVATIESVDTPDVPHLYSNGFQIGVSNADVILVLKLNNQPMATINMSYTLVKTLHQKTGDLVSKFEKAVDRKMLTTSDVDAAMAKGVFNGKQPAKQRKS